MKTSIYLFAGLFLLFTVAACNDDDDMGLNLEVPETYVFTRDGVSTVAFSEQTTRIAMAEELTAAMLDFDQTRDGLMDMFTNAAGTDPFSAPELNASSNSIRSKVAASRNLFSANAAAAARIKSDFDAWIFNQANEVFPNRNQLAAAEQAGQMADGDAIRYVSSWGLEYNQALAKGLIGALMYDQAANHYLSSAVLFEGSNQTNNDAVITADGTSYTTMEHLWDEAFGYLFGASANPAEPLTDIGEADNFLNEYVGKVADQGSFTAVAQITERSFRTGRAAIVAGQYDTEVVRQTIMIRAELNKVLAARASYYLCEATADLEASPANKGGAFHALSKAYGFIYSLRFIAQNSGNFVPADFTIISDILLSDLRNENDFGFWGLNADEIRNVNNALQLAAVTAGIYPSAAFFCD
ncbi:MAG: DUF4856 domain-containing protein [Lewinella sp.]|nr:DUF4856 domain-containing protein [Lewinella sp.]